MLGQYSHTKKDKISSVVNIFFFFFYHIYSEKGGKRIKRGHERGNCLCI